MVGLKFVELSLISRFYQPWRFFFLNVMVDENWSYLQLIWFFKTMTFFFENVISFSKTSWLEKFPRSLHFSRRCTAGKNFSWQKKIHRANNFLQIWPKTSWLGWNLSIYHLFLVLTNHDVFFSKCHGWWKFITFSINMVFHNHDFFFWKMSFFFQKRLRKIFRKKKSSQNNFMNKNITLGIIFSKFGQKRHGWAKICQIVTYFSF